MIKCPECNGEKGVFYNPDFSQQIDRKSSPKWFDCTLCKGSGEVARITFSIYAARESFVNNQD